MRYKHRPHVLLRIKNVLTQPSVHNSMPRRTVNKGGFLQPPRAFCSIIKQSLVLWCSALFCTAAQSRLSIESSTYIVLLLCQKAGLSEEEVGKAAHSVGFSM
jgi:hypothetical protein